jgi:hypothetical protein
MHYLAFLVMFRFPMKHHPIATPGAPTATPEAPTFLPAAPTVTPGTPSATPEAPPVTTPGAPTAAPESISGTNRMTSSLITIVLVIFTLFL